MRADLSDLVCNLNVDVNNRFVGTRREDTDDVADCADGAYADS